MEEVETVTVVEEEPEDTDEAAAEVSTADACIDLAKPMAHASAAMAHIASPTTDDPQAAVDSWRILSGPFETASVEAKNAEVAALSAKVATDAHALTDQIERVYVDEDFGAMGDFTEANDAFFASYSELLDFCAPAE